MEARRPHKPKAASSNLAPATVTLTNEQMREYQRNRAHERLKLARERLGGKCASCGADGYLEFDHVDPATKDRKVSEATNWSMQRFLSEVDKCQLLCKDCHLAKSLANGDIKVVGHGGGAKGKRGCKCEACKAKRREYQRQFR